MRRRPDPSRPIVLKVGSSSLTDPDGGIDPAALDRVVDQVDLVRRRGFQCVLVTSGAVAAGLPALGLRSRPSDIPGLQAAAAVGQGRLMERYTSGFARRDVVAGQVLLTREVFGQRDQYLHARQALQRMLSLGVVPIVNENDTVVVEELRFGDNDRLAALVSHLVMASILVILTDQAGIFTSDPGSDGAELLDAVRHSDEILDGVTAGRTGPLGSGGIATKIVAARMAAWSGIPTVVASATEPDVVGRVMDAEPVGTWVDPRKTRLPARKLWIAFGRPSRGIVIVDDGAVEALVSRGTSLLPVGVERVEGGFEAGDAVDITAPDRRLIAKGIARCSAPDARLLAGRNSGGRSEELVHRDDMVVFVV